MLPEEPALEHLMQVARKLRRRLVILGPNGELPPRPIALVLWAHQLGSSVALRSIDASQGPVDPGDRLLRVRPHA